MSRKLYAVDLLKKIVDEEELRILEVLWEDSIPLDKKVELILKEDRNCLNLE